VTTPDARSPSPGDETTLRGAVACGVVVGLAQAATPVAFWWLDAAAVYALGLAAIAFVYIGFAVADGRAKIIVVESVIALAFVVVAAAGVTASAWLLGFRARCSRGEGHVAATSSVRFRNPMVAAVLRRRGLGRSGHHRCRDCGGVPLPLLAPRIVMPRATRSERA
jgi:hypothetical protein